MLQLYHSMKLAKQQRQHFVDFGNGETSWGKSHPLRYPVEKNFTQVHHFKWDYTVLQRLKK